jgi:FkbH-like protein
MFIDNEPFERDEVKNEHQEIFCFDASEYRKLLDHPRLNPRFITQDSKRRRPMYLEDIQRKVAEKEYRGPRKEFLASLNMELTIKPAKEDDLKRAEELTIRTNQLNTTGRTYDYEELKGFMHSNDHLLFVCELKDRYGDYGKIGLSLIETSGVCWTIKLFLMSCRVMAYGVGSIFLSHIIREAKKAGKKLRADFIHTGKNRMMYITLKFSHFREVESNNENLVILENDLSKRSSFPPYVRVFTG